ncbi:hypothetical protein NKH77_04430 [Streptomyces sp. M19]
MSGTATPRDEDEPIAVTALDCRFPGRPTPRRSGTCSAPAGPA